MRQFLYSLTALEQWLVGLSVLFVTLALLTLLVLLTSRVIKTLVEVWRQRLIQQYQVDLNSIIINQLSPPAAAEFHLRRLRNSMGTTTFARQVLIEQIQGLHKNLLGATAVALSYSYKRLELQNVSARNVNSLKWEKKAKAIIELAQMDVQAHREAISRFLRHRNAELREVSFIAQLRLSGESALDTLSDYPYPLTPWLRLRLFHALQSLDARKLPRFKKWFQNTNTEVVLFAISMTRQYQQADAVPDLLNLLEHPSKKVQGLAVETLGMLGAVDYILRVAEFGDANWEDEKLCIRVVRCIGRLGTTSDLSRLGKFLGHPVYEVRFHAAVGLVSLSGGTEYLKRAAGENPSLVGILRHVTDPLLTS